MCRGFIKKMFAKVIFAVFAVTILFANVSNANNLTNATGYDSRWVKVGDEWKVRNSDGSYLSNCWFFDTVQLRWYRIGASDGEVLTGTTGGSSRKDSSSMLYGLWTDKSTNKSFFFDIGSKLTFGSLIETNGYYVVNGQSVYLEFEQNDANTKGSITKGLTELRNLLMRGGEITAPRANAGDSSGGGSSGGGSSGGGGGGKDKPVAQKVKKTILLYLVGSDLEERGLTASDDLYQISKPNYPSDVRVLVFTGGSRMSEVEKARKQNSDKELEKVFNVNWEINQIWEARNGIHSIESNFGSEAVTDKSTFIKFLNYVKKYYPSEEYNIILNDHGGGANGGLGVDTRKSEYRDKSLSLADIKDSFDKTIPNFGFIGFDACLMANIEYLYGLSDYADYFIASSELEYGSWDYNAFAEQVKNSKISNEDLLIKVIDYYIKQSVSGSNILSLFNLRNFKKNVDSSLSAFAKDVYELSLKDFDSLKELVQARAGSVEYGLHINLDFVDLYDYANVVRDNQEIPQATKDVIRKLWDDVSQHIIYYNTNRAKDPSGYSKVGGVSMYFPLQLLDITESSTTLNKFYDSVEDIYNDDYNVMLRAVFTRMALAKKIVELTEDEDAQARTKLDNTVLSSAKKLIGLTDDEINKIQTNVYPGLLRYRLINTTNSNFSFEKAGRPGELVVTYKKYLDTYLNDVYAVPLAYDEYGREVSLGHVTIPYVKTEDTENYIWNITPREGYWFKLKDTKNDVVSSFYPTELEIVNGDEVGESYLFDKTITGYVPIVLSKKVILEFEVEFPALMYVNFVEGSNTATILGYSEFDITDVFEPSKMITKFAGNEKIKPIYNFEEAIRKKKISYIGKELEVGSLNVLRGALNNACIFYDYYLYDAFTQKTKLKLTDGERYTFKDTTNNKNFSMLGYETWYDYQYRSTDNSIYMKSEVDGHGEEMTITVNTVPAGNTIYDDFSNGKTEFSNKTINYFRQKDFDNIATSSITIVQYEVEEIASLDSAYMLMMGAIKEVGGVESAFTKMYVVSPRKNVMYLFDVTLWAKDSNYIYNNYKMINYIANMIEDQDETFTSTIEVDINPLVVNSTYTTALGLYGIEGYETVVATASELSLDEVVATTSETTHAEVETTNEVEETTTEIAEQTSVEESTAESTEQTSAEETTAESIEQTSEEETTVESIEQTSEEETTIESIEQTSEEEETAKENIEETSGEDETTVESVEETHTEEEPIIESDEATSEEEEPTGDVADTSSESEESTADTAETTNKNEEQTKESGKTLNEG